VIVPFFLFFESLFPFQVDELVLETLMVIRENEIYRYISITLCPKVFNLLLKNRQKERLKFKLGNN